MSSTLKAGFYKLLILLTLSPNPAFARDCIGLVTGSGDNFWKEVYQGAKKAGDEFNYRIHYRGPSTEAGHEAQGIILEAFSTLGCVGLLLAPNHPDRIEQVEAIRNKNIVTMFIDRGLPNLKDIPVVATDNYAAGRFAAKNMVPLLPPNAQNIAVFRLQKDVVTTTAREQGFIDEITKHGLQVVIDAYGGTNVGDVKYTVYKALKNSPVAIHGIFTPNETTTIGAVEGTALLYLPTSPILIGFDANDYIKKAIKENKLTGTVVQKPHDMGYIGVALIHNFLKSGSPPKSVVTGLEFLSKNMESVKSANGEAH
ncbi:periplasmic binding protein/LacI transcriptional regulator [Oleiphilus messinensis]|uniref:Periplasmic binding protein/LacI transcriptional regulator n=1 Tax=Oleiphilus messinensis TaxID=141451 RepID=A0A1Y0ICC1_9GAMM|nr:substrate-binding domain-containing protein [Oleiphilus messinensis]ARU57426.1 periplasmic binding protein/LacI transcriptional regulator [Oleiphilus messinensis]